MLLVNLALAFIVALPVWYVGSRALAQIVYVAESRHPRIATSSIWHAGETLFTFSVFVGSVAFWLALSYLLQQVSR